MVRTAASPPEAPVSGEGEREGPREGGGERERDHERDGEKREGEKDEEFQGLKGRER